MHWRSGRRAVWLVAALLLATLCLAADPDRLPNGKAGGTTGDPGTVGQWSAPFDLHVIGVHSTVLPSGKVLLFSYPAERAQHGSDTWTWNSATGQCEQIPSPPHRDLF